MKLFKVKDNIDLKVLKNYGFIEGYFNYMRENTDDESLFWNETFIDKNTKILYERYEPCGNRFLIDNNENIYIQDLISANLIEWVEYDDKLI